MGNGELSEDGIVKLICPSKQTTILIRGTAACLAYEEINSFMVRVSKW